ncbi:MAG: CBS domain-containing protein [Burkholderiaceae bacterium]|jgi:CBS domain-containing protein|nr:CBS domain-containing protein [Burkholderiaceae bacterium]
MFFVFGPSGQMLRGGPEQIARVAALRGVRRPQALRATGPRGVAQAEPVAPPFPAAPATDSAFGSLRALGGVSAYAQTDQGPAVARQPLTLVRDVMTTGALTVAQGALVSEAWHLFAEHGVAQAPVVDTLGRVIGLLLRADMAPSELIPQAGGVPAAIARARRPVDEVMVSPVPAAAATTGLRRVATVLLETGLPGLPVTNELGLLEGFISRTDILRAVAADPPLDLWT